MRILLRTTRKTHKLSAVRETASLGRFHRRRQKLGYVQVDSNHKDNGLSSRVAAKLLKDKMSPLFATTDHTFMKRTLG
jgi:hypothetical protein